MVGNPSVRTVALLALSLLVAQIASDAQEPATLAPPAASNLIPQRDRLQGHVATLASEEFGGRSGKGARLAEAYIVDQFRELGLVGAFGGRFTQDILDPSGDFAVGRNVGAVIPGSDPALDDQWIVLSAHYDHLGIQDGVLYPGADDNASGVAMLLETARCLVDAPERPRRGILLLAFDLEELGLIGSKYFVEHPCVPLEQIQLFITADLIGGALGGVCREQVFILGTEYAPELATWVRDEAAPLPLKPAVVGSDLLVFDRSDYGPFRARKVPFLFFSTGENPKYHTPQDTADALDFDKLRDVSRLIARVVNRAAAADALPAWNNTPVHDLGEVLVLQDILTILLEHRDALQIGGFQVTVMKTTLEQLQGILDRGAMTEPERARLIRTVQIILLTVL